jgi:hypothetical protein
MGALIVPACQFLPAAAARFIAAHPELPVLFVDRFPEGIAEMPSGEDALMASALEGRRAVPLDVLSETLRCMGISDGWIVSGATAALQSYHYRADGRNLLMLMNTSASETLHLTVQLPEAASCGRYDAMRDRMETLETDGGRCELTIAPYQSAVLVTNPEQTVPARPALGRCVGTIPLERFDLTLRPIGGGEECLPDFELRSVSGLRRDFSGELCYTASVRLDRLPARAVFSAQYLYECMELTVNGRTLDKVYVPPYEQEIGEALRLGDNELTVRVATTALRDANARPGPFGGERTVLEPTGMFGRVELRLYESQTGTESTSGRLRAADCKKL